MFGFDLLGYFNLVGVLLAASVELGCLCILYVCFDFRCLLLMLACLVTGFCCCVVAIEIAGGYVCICETLWFTVLWVFGYCVCVYCSSMELCVGLFRCCLTYLLGRLLCLLPIFQFGVLRCL